MKNCIEIEKYFDRALYNELSDEERNFFETHLEKCADCRSKFEELEQTLALMNRRERNEPDPEFMNNFWNELEPRLKPNHKSGDTLLDKVTALFTFEKRISVQAAGAIAILIIGILIGKYYLTGDAIDQPINYGETEIRNEQIIQARAERYLDRSKVLLLGLMNFDSGSDDIGVLNLRQQQQISSELIAEAADLKNNLGGSSQKQLQRLITEVELILLQIANLELENDLSGIELIQDGVDRRGIFLKINIQKLNEAKTQATPENHTHETEVKS